MLGMLGAVARRGLRRATMLIRHRSGRDEINLAKGWGAIPMSRFPSASMAMRHARDMLLND